MRTTRSIRGSDHALVQRISHVAYGDDAQDQSLPDGCWDLVFMKRRGLAAGAAYRSDHAPGGAGLARPATST